jgi:hypothetical protein
MSLRHPPSGVVAVFTPALKEFNLPPLRIRLALSLSITHRYRRKARQAPLETPANKKGDGASRAKHTRPTLSQ